MKNKGEDLNNTRREVESEKREGHVHVVYVHGGCIDLVGCPWWGKIKWLKNLSISEGILRRVNSSMVMYLPMPTFIRRMLCMFMGGCANLVGYPLWGKIEWLKDLSISERMLRHFNSSMVKYLKKPTVHASYDTRNSITMAVCTLY